MTGVQTCALPISVELPGFEGLVEVVALAGEPLIDGRYDINEVLLGAPFVS